ncbi:MAG: ATP-binding cassette domain-containing protein [Gammaproteobacteria bacterium]|nr:ATP-binding cassette domain-containing protein [Gammaproteobacteria bacterium]
MTEPKIKIENLYKIFGPNPKSVIGKVQDGMSKQELLENHGHVFGLKDINIDIPAKGVSVIMGLSGSGKSTLIRHINRLIDPTSGKMIVDGDDVLSMDKDQLIEFRRYKASMVFQKFGLHVHRTVAENAAYGLIVQGKPVSEAKQLSQKWIERVGLGGFEGHYPSQLSGGMQQRVGLARALSTDAEILLMDEAFSALDPLIRTDMQDVLLGLQEELHKTIVFITHDLDEALRIGDNIAILRDGAVIQQGDPQDIIMHPSDDYIVDFIQDINRSRVIRLKTLMTPSTSASDSGPELQHTMNLELALPKIANSASKSATVVNEKGEVVGSISLDQIISGITRPDVDTGSSETRYR